MKFALGDPVRITTRNTRYFDHIGTVTDIDRTMHFPFRVTGLEEQSLWFGSHELTLVTNMGPLHAQKEDQ